MAVIPDTLASGGNRLPFGVLAYSGAGISLGICFAKGLYLSVLPAFGLVLGEFSFNPHVQAVLMWLFALIGVVGLVLDRRRCGSAVPMMLGVISFAVIVGTLYGPYRINVLMMAYTVLVLAAFLSQSLRLRELNRQVTAQAETVSSLNATLEQRVEEQVGEIESLGRLKRFLAPAVAELLVEEGEGASLDNHRRYIAALFCDMRGFTAFSESQEPEEVMGVLGAYHEQMGRLAAEHEATIDHRAGDGLMLFFNDPIPVDRPVLKAVRLALAMRENFHRLNVRWKKLGYELGFGIGIASGYATLGVVGYEGRYDYTANGNAVNLAARLCDHAEDGQILLSPRALVEVEDDVEVVPVGEVALKGMVEPVAAYNVLDLAEATRSTGERVERGSRCS